MKPAPSGRKAQPGFTPLRDLTSHDLEDVLNIVDGREELREEKAAAPMELRQAVVTSFRPLLKSQDFAKKKPSRRDGFSGGGAGRDQPRPPKPSVP